MAIPPKSSLVERLVQDRLRSGDLESSAARLLNLGSLPPGPADGDENTALSGMPLGRAVANGTGLARPDGPPPGMITLGGPASPAAPLTQSSMSQPLMTQPLMSAAEIQAAGVPPPAAPAPAPIAMELRPMAAPAPQPAEISPFPLPGFAASALVPPPASGLQATSTAAVMEAPDETVSMVAPTAFAGTVPAQPISAATESARPDLVQGPPTIDAIALERGGMVDWSRTRSRISEEFRLVQRQILRAAFGPGAEPGFSNLLMVTSARPGEGKSFTSVNLAGSIARQGDHHVLLVDADSKRDSFCYSLGLAEMRGLLDLVANTKLDPAPLIVKTPIDRLSILPVGRERERSAELFSTKEMTRLIQSLGRRYADRLLVLDAPPCLSTSDPAVLAPVVGQILFVVEADRTQRDEVEASLDLIQACPNITLVLNKQQISSRYTFGAYSSYYSS